jgi:hypothetical protein
MKFWIIALVFIAGLPLAASTRVAFIEFLDSKGIPIPLEAGGRFGHIAISYEDGWLHAHPRGEVRVVSEKELRATGRLALIIELPESFQIPKQLVQTYLGRPYDPNFSWSDEKLYCSELVGKLLGFSPEPMDFSSDYWRGYPHQILDRDGLSPDDIHKKLRSSISERWHGRTSCQRIWK